MIEQQPADLYPYRAQLRVDDTLICTLERPAPFRVSAEPVGVAVTLTGELDLSSVTGLDECLRDVQAHNRHVVLDLRRLAFMDTAGLRAILAARQRAARAGHEIAVLSVPGQVQRMLELCGVLRPIDTASSLTPTS